jgi:hypothetical protein
MASHEYFMTGGAARWRVAWVVKKKGKPPYVIEKDFEQDLNAAIDLYCKAKRAGKPMATLVCCNVGFPPPEKYQPYTKQVKRKHRGRITLETIAVTPMHEVNLQGVWWCPYCRQMRRFKHQDGFEQESVFVAEEGLHCQICSSSHRDGHVRKWNPVARNVSFKQTRRSSGSRGRGSRRSKNNRRSR